MIPDHYLLIALGLMVGSALGFLAAALMKHRAQGRSYRDGWNAARRHYLTNHREEEWT
jgi:uncharacterized membrane-anchored protein YhcB (DUF1043 family)